MPRINYQNQKTKYCNRCSTVKPIGDFAVNNSKPTGYSDWCKQCINARQHEKRQEEREHWFAENPTQGSFLRYIKKYHARLYISLTKNTRKPC